MKPLILLLIVLGLSTNPVSAETPQGDLCAVLQAVYQNDGRNIPVRGEYRYGAEIEGLYGENCSGVLNLRGATWPWAISIRWISASASQALKEAIREQYETKRVCQVLVTLRGRIKSNQNNSSYVDRQGRRQWVGFGHLNVFPAQIEVDSFDGSSLVVRPIEPK